MRGRLNLRPKGCHRRQYFCAYPQAERDSTVGVQGQAPSDDPELARFLVEQGTVLDTLVHARTTEQTLKSRSKVAWSLDWVEPIYCARSLATRGCNSHA